MTFAINFIMTLYQYRIKFNYAKKDKKKWQNNLSLCISNVELISLKIVRLNHFEKNYIEIFEMTILN